MKHRGANELGSMWFQPKALLPLIFLTVVLSLASGAVAASQRGASGVRIRTRAGQHIKLYQDYRALVIGISNYKYWPPLPQAVKDAEEVAHTLQKLGFKVKQLLNPTSEQLRDVLRGLPYNLGSKPNTALLIYFAGHGATETLADGSKLGYLVPADCPLSKHNPAGFASKAISMGEIENLALRIKCRHVLMAFDSCFSGAIFAMVRAEPDYITDKVAKPVRQFLAAGDENEAVPDKSIFKQVFIDGVRGGADQDRDGYVTGTELGMYLQNKVVQYSRRTQHPQFGRINNPKLDKGDFVFVVAPKNSPVGAASTSQRLTAVAATTGNNDSPADSSQGNPIGMQPPSDAISPEELYQKALKTRSSGASMSMLKQVLDKDSDFWPAYQKLAWLQGLRGQYREAIENYKRALKIHDSQLAHYELGRLYRIVGNKRSAIHHLRLAAVGQNALARQARRMLYTMLPQPPKKPSATKTSMPNASNE